MARGGYIKAVTTAPADLVVLGGDIVGSDTGEDTKITLTESRAKVIVDDSVRLDAQLTQIDLTVGVGQGITVDSAGKTVLAFPLRTVTTSTTLASTDGVVCCDTSSNTITITLPDPSTIAQGRFFWVADLGSAGSNAITIECATANTGGEASVVLDVSRQQVAVVSRGTEWLVF